MGKKLEDIRITIDSDLTEASYESARSQIIGDVKEKGITKSIYNSDWYVLTIASQNMGTALALRISHNFTIDISCQYERDEWSLTRNSIIEKTKTEPYKNQSITVWSPGA